MRREPVHVVPLSEQAKVVPRARCGARLDVNRISVFGPEAAEPGTPVCPACALAPEPTPWSHT